MLCVKDTTPKDRLYKPLADLPYLRLTYGLCAILCAVSYRYSDYLSPLSFSDLVVAKSQHIFNLVTSGPSTYADLSDFTTFTTFVAVYYWVALSFADLKFAGRTKASWFGILFNSVLSTFAVGPAATVLFMWAWREEIMSKKLVFDH